MCAHARARTNRLIPVVFFTLTTMTTMTRVVMVGAVAGQGSKNSG